MVPEVFEAHPL